MPNYRRLYGARAYSFTLVTWNRIPILTQDHTRKILRQAWELVGQRHPFTTLAVCLLPDHLHAIWTLPEGDADYSMRWKEIKRQFTHRYLAEGETHGERNPSRIQRGEAAVWQRRFWEHMIMDDADLNRHIDYIHFNPVKHGLVKQAKDWPWSSFHRYVRQGNYDPDWGQAGEYKEMGKFGE